MSDGRLDDLADAIREAREAREEQECERPKENPFVCGARSACVFSVDRTGLKVGVCTCFVFGADMGQSELEGHRRRIHSAARWFRRHVMISQPDSVESRGSE